MWSWYWRCWQLSVSFSPFAFLFPSFHAFSGTTVPNPSCVYAISASLGSVHFCGLSWGQVSGLDPAGLEVCPPSEQSIGQDLAQVFAYRAGTLELLCPWLVMSAQTSHLPHGWSLNLGRPGVGTFMGHCCPHMCLLPSPTVTHNPPCM